MSKIAGNLKVYVLIPLASETPSAFKSASTVAPELVLTLAYNFIIALAKGTPAESTVLRVNLQSVFFSHDVEITIVKQVLIFVNQKYKKKQQHVSKKNTNEYCTHFSY